MMQQRLMRQQSGLPYVVGEVAKNNCKVLNTSMRKMSPRFAVFRLDLQ